jgi:hypothetical protein
MVLVEPSQRRLNAWPDDIALAITLAQPRPWFHRAVILWSRSALAALAIDLRHDGITPRKACNYYFFNSIRQMRTQLP